MNFTREPIIETIITPREGMTLLVRNSKGADREDYSVDAVEVVSFGHSFFFRSLERPKSFLVPVSDYEILELKEVRMPLKNVVPERSVKIGGGREGRPPREVMPEEREHPPENIPERLAERPSERKRRRGRRGGGRHESQTAPEARSQAAVVEDPFSGEEGREEPKAPVFISKLFPPPPILIKETLSRYKPAEGLEGEQIFSLPEKERDEEIPPSNSSAPVFEE